MSAKAMMRRAIASLLLASATTPALGQVPPVPLPRTLKREFNAAKFFDVSRGYVWGDGARTAILATEDGGTSWRLVMDITSSTPAAGATVARARPPRAAFFFDPDRFWVLDDHAVLNRTIDGGRSFTQFVLEEYVDPRGTKDIRTCAGLFFRDEHEGWAACLDALLHTTDSGAHWEPLRLPKESPWVSYVWMFDDREGIAVGEGLMRTTDGGATWEVIPGPFARNRDADQVSCTANGFCAALVWIYGPLLVSNDRGLTWVDAKIPLKPGRQDTIWQAQVIGPNQVTAVGQDGGVNFEEMFAQGGPRFPTHAPAQGLVLKWDGSTWTRITHAVPNAFSGGYFVDDSNGWLLSYEHQIYKTTDGGQTLQLVNDYFRQLAALTPTEAPIVFETPTPSTP